MQNRNELGAQFELISTLKLLAHAYEEVSVIRMQKVRSSVLTNRSFMEKLSEVFHDVKEGYRKEILSLMHIKNKGKKKFSFSANEKNGRTVYVFISSNARLYGDIIKKVFTLFIENLKKDENADIAIVGKLGKDLFDQQESVQRKYTYFEMPDNNVIIGDLKDLVTFLIPYDDVNVFYGQFNNLVNQDAAASSVSGDQPLSAEDEEDKKYTYVFEPSLEKVLKFFETQVFASLLKQTIHEGELARLASRVKAMESALGNIEKEEKNLVSETRRLRKSIENKKRIEGLAGATLWG